VRGDEGRQRGAGRLGAQQDRQRLQIDGEAARGVQLGDEADVGEGKRISDEKPVARGLGGDRLASWRARARNRRSGGKRGGSGYRSSRYSRIARDWASWRTGDPALSAASSSSTGTWASGFNVVNGVSY